MYRREKLFFIYIFDQYKLKNNKITFYVFLLSSIITALKIINKPQILTSFSNINVSFSRRFSSFLLAWLPFMIDHNILYQCSTQQETKQPQSHKEWGGKKYMYVQMCAICEGQSREKKHREKRKVRAICWWWFCIFFYVHVREVV